MVTRHAKPSTGQPLSKALLTVGKRFLTDRDRREGAFSVKIFDGFFAWASQR